MERIVSKAIKEYQCPGCISGPFESCPKNKAVYGEGCGDHHPATVMYPGGKIFLGMPNGFSRLGQQEIKLIIFKKFEDLSVSWQGKGYDRFNIPCWKYLNEHGHTIVKGLHPRINQSFQHVFLESCIDKINCVEISEKEIEEMD